MTALVDRLMRLLLTGENELAATLRSQYERATLEELEHTGNGFLAYFEIPKDVARVTPPNITGGDVFFDIEGLKHGGGCVLFIRDGLISFLDGYVYDGELPERPIVTAIRDVIPVTKVR